MAYLAPSELTRLKDACRQNYDLASESRKLRAACIRTAAGTDYPDTTGDGLYDYVPKMRQAELAATISLAANRPRVLVTTHNPELRAWAKKKSRALDAYAKALHMERILQRCARAGFYGLGVAKVAMMELPATRMRAYAYSQVGRPGVADPSTDHLVWDMEGADFDCLSFIGDRYKVRFSDAIEDVRFTPEGRRQLKDMGAESFSRAKSQDWAENIAQSTFHESARFQDFAYLADVYVASAQCIYTFGVNSDFEILTDPLTNGVEWEGKPTGPYSFFSLGVVPGNTKPASPAQFLMRQHELINTCHRKINEGIEQLKDVFLGQTGDEGDAMRIRSAPNNSIITLNGATGLRRETFGGPSQQLMGVRYMLEDVFDETGGNIKQRLGLGPSADTLGQEEIVNAGAAGVTAYEQGLFADFARDIYTELGDLLDRDASTRIPMTLTVPGTGVSIADDWLPATMDGARPPRDENGDPPMMDTEIEPYDLPYKSPVRQAEECRAAWNEMLPQWEQMAAAGVQPDIAAYLDGQARLRNNPYLRELFKFGQPAAPVGAAREPASGGGGNPNKPNGRYRHTSRSGSATDRRGEILQMMSAPQPQTTGAA